MTSEKRKEAQRIDSQNLRNKKAASTDRLSQIADRIEDAVNRLEKSLKEKGDEGCM
jgi:hypothetical protein